MALLAAPGGYVLGVEKVPELAARSIITVQACCPGLLPPGALAFEGRHRGGGGGGEAPAGAEGEVEAPAPAGAEGEGEGQPLLEIVHGNVLAGECSWVGHAKLRCCRPVCVRCGRSWCLNAPCHNHHVLVFNFPQTCFRASRLSM